MTDNTSFQCTHCDFETDSKKGLNIHFSRMHPNPHPPWQCEHPWDLISKDPGDIRIPGGISSEIEEINPDEKSVKLRASCVCGVMLIVSADLENIEIERDEYDKND